MHTRVLMHTQACTRFCSRRQEDEEERPAPSRRLRGGKHPINHAGGQRECKGGGDPSGGCPGTCRSVRVMGLDGCFGILGVNSWHISPGKDLQHPNPTVPAHPVATGAGTPPRPHPQSGAIPRHLAGDTLSLPTHSLQQPQPRGKTTPGAPAAGGEHPKGGDSPWDRCKTPAARGCPLLPALTGGWLMWLGWEELPGG